MKYIETMKKMESIQIRLTEPERKMVEDQAAKLGLSISAYVRMLIYKNKEKRK